MWNSFSRLSSSSIITAAMSTSASSSSSSSKKGALIFLHGLGDTPAGWSQLEMLLPQMKSRLNQIHYVFPPAPTIGITINGGMQMPGWFDLYDWPISVGSKDDTKGLQDAVNQIEKEIQNIHTEQKIPYSKIVVGGFSQGGAIALLSAYRPKERTLNPLGGCVGLSAWLTEPNELQIDTNVAKNTPMFWGHGKYDDKVLFEQQAFGVTKLRQQDVSVIDKQYDVDHGSVPEELEAMAEFVDHVIFDNNDDDDDTKKKDGTTEL